jgi:hypothetical protein
MNVPYTGDQGPLPPPLDVIMLLPVRRVSEELIGILKDTAKDTGKKVVCRALQACLQAIKPGHILLQISGSCKNI